MVQFGKRLKSIVQSRPNTWKNAYVDYESLKYCLKQFSLAGKDMGALRLADTHFCALIDEQDAKVVQRFDKAMCRIKKKFSEICHGDFDEREEKIELANELVDLLEYVIVNLSAFRKILKKHDKIFRRCAPLVSLNTSSLYDKLAEDAPGYALRQLVSINTDFINTVIDGIDDVECSDLCLSLRSSLSRVNMSRSVSRFMTAKALIEDDHCDVLLNTIAINRDASDRCSQLINLLCTLIYLCNYYVVVPSANSYMHELHAPSWLAGLMLGLAPLGACCSTVLFSFWANSSFRLPLLTGAVLCLFGNIIYANALDYQSVSMALTGRLLVGLGGQRCVNRRFIADTICDLSRTRASLSFVVAGAVGQALGPALAALMSFIDVSFVFIGRQWTFNFETMPGWIMSFAWCMFLLLAILRFRDVPSFKRLYTCRPCVAPNSLSTYQLESLGLPLLDPTHEQHHNHSRCSSSSSSLSSSLSHSITRNSGFQWRPVTTCLLSYFTLKLSQEVLTVSIPDVASRYFGWSNAIAGVYLALLAVLLLPINMTFGYISNRYSDRVLMITAQVCLAGGAFIMLSFQSIGLPLQLSQYLVGSIIVFISSQMLEAFTMSILSKVVGQKLASGIFNSSN